MDKANCLPEADHNARAPSLRRQSAIGVGGGTTRASASRRSRRHRSSSNFEGIRAVINLPPAAYAKRAVVAADRGRGRRRYDVGFMQIPKEKKSTTHSNIAGRDLLSVCIARSLRELARPSSQVARRRRRALFGICVC